MPSELWDLENGAEDGAERKAVEGRHDKDEEADEGGGKKHLEKARRCQQLLLWPQGLKKKTEINYGNFQQKHE